MDASAYEGQWVGFSGAPEMVWPDRVKLPVNFDADALRADLDALAGLDWTEHFVKQNFEGDWSVLPLRGNAKATHPIQMIYPDHTATEFVDWPPLERTPMFREVIAALGSPVRYARLMRLTPGSVIKEHFDMDLMAEMGTARVHVPVTTNPDVEFLLNRERVDMKPGETWYLRLSDPHSVANRGASDRIHLVLDVEVDDAFEAMLGAGA